jgi:hypothetical protein
MSKITYPRTAAELRALLSMGFKEVRELLRSKGLRLNLGAFMKQYYKERQHTTSELEQLNQAQMEWQQQRIEQGQPDAVMLYHRSGAKELAGFTYKELNYEKKDRNSYQKERNQEWNAVRPKFLTKLATDPETKQQLIEAGVPADQIQRMAGGKCPVIDGKRYQVHHRIPLDDGGTNDFKNLILIRDSFEHRSVHGNYNPSEKVAKALNVGDSARVAHPIPPTDTVIYPNPAKGYEGKDISNADYIGMISKEYDDA